MAHNHLQAIFNSFINYNSSFIISLIPEAPNRQTTLLKVVASGCIANEIEQGAVPSIVNTALRRTPPSTEAAKAVVTSIVVAEPARKRRK